MQQDLEQRLISSIINEKILGDILLHGISSEEFLIHTEVFTFIQTYFNRYNSIPARAIIESSFPGFNYLDDVKEHEIKYLCDELIKSSTKRKAIELINESSELLTKDPYGAIDSLVNRLSNIRRPVNYSRSYADADAPKRYAKALENRDKIKKGISTGLKTGISLFDDKYLGWQPGNLIGIVGRLGVGKSTLAEFLACQTYQTGKRVLYLSPEMSVDEVHLRWDTFMGRMNGYTFLNDKLQTGEINLKEYNKWLEEVKNRKDWLTLDSANGKKFSVGNINSLVNEFSPDLTVVDGVALLEGHGEKEWEKVKDISYGLKSIAQNHKIVIMVTAQANRAAGDDMPKTDQVSGGDALLQACDCGIFMAQNINKPNIRFITIPKRRNGQAINTPLEIKFNINEGIISV